MHRELRVGVFVLLGALLGATAYAEQQKQQTHETHLPAPLATDGGRYRVTAIVLAYASDHPAHPPLEQMMRVTVRLTLTGDGYVAPRPGDTQVAITLDQIPELEQQWFYASAIRTISEALVQAFNRHGLIGIFVAPAPSQFDDAGNDIRPEDAKAMVMVISTDVVRGMKSIASGDRFGSGENLEAHRRILEGSPVRPYAAGDTARLDLLSIDALDEYAYRKSRHPGRRVDVAVTAVEDEETGEAGTELEFMVYEEKPWRVYAQISNTGTEQTEEWREQFGFSTTQLTGNDDIFTLDYITAGFSSSHAVIASYNAPLFDAEDLRFAINALYSQYDASEVGIQNASFTGDTIAAGGQIIWNVFQEGNFFVDLFAGGQWQYLAVTDELLGTTGRVNLALADAGVQFEKFDDTSGTFGTVGLQTLINSPSRTELTELGRIDPDDHWLIMNWALFHYFYLEPLLNPEAWADPSTAASSTLAHELAMTFRGQYAFGYRLIPQFEQTVGGLYTVRGYPESAVVGDTALIANFEYRFHVPRVFGVQPDPNKSRLFGRSFRFRPQEPYGRADWDLILRAFVDVGQTLISHRVPGESDATLVGTGVGLEFQFQENVSLRCDWGIALTDVNRPGPDITAGSNRFHFAFLFLY